MAELSVLWLRTAAALYALGLVHGIVTLVRKRDHLFRPALVAFGFAALLHLVSIVEEGALSGALPVNNIYESLSLCAMIIAGSYLFVYWRYKIESLSVFVFPVVFIMTLMGTFGNPIDVHTSPEVRSTWLAIHIVLVLLGYAALLFTAVASVLYLFQERELKRKKPRNFYYKLPPLGDLDDLISRSMTFGFVFITLGIVVGSTWAFVEWGTGWIGEPRIGISIATWAIYLAMVFLRVNAGWRGRKAALLSIAALCCSAITWAAHSGLRLGGAQ
ncbi:MAG: hypothetical protein EXQ52_12435 [Bryobacterales bacterium]|nr:hypothetical protein [Bryobacterales bacterium]